MMRRIFSSYFFFIYSLALFLPICIPAVLAQTWQAGVASTVITPREPIWLGGYGGKKTPALGKIHDLHLKALALSDPQGNRAVIVTADLIGFSREYTEAVTAEITRKFGLPRDAVLINTSHTHCGPETRAERDAVLGMPEEYKIKNARYVEELKGVCVETVGKALKDMKPAAVTFSGVEMSAPFAVCRRVPTPHGIEYHSGPSSYYTGGPRDDTVPVLKVAAPDGKLRAALFGYACHPITLSVDYYCGDYPGFAQQYVEEAYPGAVAMFMQGCGAQLVPNARFQIEYAQGHGRTLADAVKKALDGPQTEVSGPVRCAYREPLLQFKPLPERSVLEEAAKSKESIPTAPLLSQEKAAALLKRIDAGERIPLTVPCPVQVISFGKELLLVGLGGETTTDYSVSLKTEFQGRFVWVAGYCNSVFGYLPSLKIVREGGYEGGVAYNYTQYPGPFADDVESRVLTAVREAVKAVDGK
jgi:neutral ceramidase